MSRTSLIRVLAVLVLMAMFAAACGQKPDVHLAGAGTGGAGVGVVPSEGLSESTFVDADGDGVDDNTGLTQDQFNTQVAAGGGNTAGGTGATGGGDAGAPAGSPSGSGGGTDPGAGGGGGGNDPGGSGGGGSTRGVTADTITIGIHAPLTGAAPLPSESFRRGKDQYWSLNKVAGRTVKVEFRDDKYNPSTASQVCQELVTKVFVLIGSGGTDQIAECARVAANAGVPYLSAGVTEVNLNQLPNYFSLSKSYSQQMPLLMQIIKKEVAPANKLVGLIASNTANFDDAVAAFEQNASKAGFTPKVYRPSKQASDGEVAGIANRMSTDGVTVATPVMAPTQWIKLASNPQLRSVNWRGIGITMGLNTVATAACESSGGAIDDAAFFSPWMGLNMSGQVDPNFAKGGGKDDIEWSLWGLNKTVHAAFKKMGSNLNTQAFAQAMTGGIRSGIYPDLNHTQSNHFGATSVNVLRLDCGAKPAQFKSSSSDTFRKSF